MPYLEYSQRAIRDVTRLFEFLSANNEDSAKRAIQTIRDSLNQLCIMPKGGRMVNDTLRERIIPFGNSGYTALYSFDEVAEKIVIHAIKHQRELDYK